MFRLWARMVQNNKVIWDEVFCNDEPLTRTKKIFWAIDEICSRKNLAKPIWLDASVREFKQNARTRFTREHFTEEIEFDYLEIRVIEED